jgi:hypothetical protein
LLALQLKVTVEEEKVDPSLGLNITGGVGKVDFANTGEAKHKTVKAAKTRLFINGSL